MSSNETTEKIIICRLPFWYHCKHEGLEVYKNWTPSQVFYYEICKVFKKNIVLTLTEDCLETASDIQQYFECITYFINNQLIQS